MSGRCNLLIYNIEAFDMQVQIKAHMKQTLHFEQRGTGHCCMEVNFFNLKFIVTAFISFALREYFIGGVRYDISPLSDMFLK